MSQIQHIDIATFLLLNNSIFFLSFIIIIISFRLCRLYVKELLLSYKIIRGSALTAI